MVLKGTFKPIFCDMKRGPMCYGNLLKVNVSIMLIVSIFSFSSIEIYGQEEDESPGVLANVGRFLILEGLLLGLSNIAKRNPKKFGIYFAVASPVPVLNNDSASLQPRYVLGASFFILGMIGLGYYNINAEKDLDKAQTPEQRDEIQDEILRTNFIALNVITFSTVLFIGGEKKSTKQGNAIIPIVIFDRERIIIGARYRF